MVERKGLNRCAVQGIYSESTTNQLNVEGMKMSAIEMNSITGAGSAAAARVASALAPKNTSGTGGAAAGGSTNSAPSGTITSGDFMTLLVTELKNQDPTQPTDPNAYIQQLVGVNSLQQLISINQDLTQVTTPASTTGT